MSDRSATPDINERMINMEPEAIKAAGRGVPSTHRQVESPATSAEPVPAAPATPWTNRYEQPVVTWHALMDHARRLEALCRQQHEALQEAEGMVAYHSHDDSVGYRVCCQVASYKPHTKSCGLAKALAAYAEFAKEAEK